MKIAIINETIFRITNTDFKRINNVDSIHIKDGRRKHDAKCEYILNKYKPIFVADVMLRND